VAKRSPIKPDDASIKAKPLHRIALANEFREIGKFGKNLPRMGTLPGFDTLVFWTGCGPEPRQPTIDAREPTEPPVGYGMKHRSIIPESHLRNPPGLGQRTTVTRGVGNWVSTVTNQQGIQGWP
jgi:hypothetical protein